MKSRAISRLKIPDKLFTLIQEAQLVELSFRKYVPREILEEYGHFPIPELSECTARLKKRLSGLRTQQAVLALEEKISMNG